MGDDFMKMFRILYAWFSTGYSSRVSHGGFWRGSHIFYIKVDSDPSRAAHAAHAVHWKNFDIISVGPVYLAVTCRIPCEMTPRKFPFSALCAVLTGDTVHTSVCRGIGKLRRFST